ncbi:MAG: hypothetical protein M1815_001250 [Lichina confinis]|nr:MAG: hypothetical protein M1815_001250 [Lichina confinis]
MVNGAVAYQTSSTVNLRFSFAWCVLGFGNNDKFSTECYDTCLPTKPAVVDMILETYDGKPYDYCSSTDSAFMKNYEPCANCLADSSNQTIQANFVRALSEACVQKAEPPETMKLSTDVFLAKPRAASTATSPESTSSLTADTSTASTAPASASTSPSLDAERNVGSNSLAAGQVVGIGVGSGVATIGTFLVLWTLYRHCRRRQLRQQELDKQTREGYDGTAKWPYQGYADGYIIPHSQEMSGVNTTTPLREMSRSARDGLIKGQEHEHEPPRTPMVEAATNPYGNAGANTGRRGPSSAPELMI